jgi:hypothetical protein
MRSVLKLKREELPLTTQVLLTELIRAFSQGKDSVVERICGKILTDIDNLCGLHKKLGSEKVEGMKIPNATHSWIEKGRFRGRYAGFGLGEKWLGLGFLEEPVVKALMTKLGSMSTMEKQEQTTSTWTSLHYYLYETPMGTFELFRSYTWFLKKKIE